MDIDWDEVDQFPLFDGCNELASRQEQRSCFETEMHKQFQQAFSDTVYEVDLSLKDTIYVDFEVDEDGFVNITEIGYNQEIEKAVPGFRNEVRKRFKDITVRPAIKQDVFVKMRMRLPIVLDTRD